MDSRWMDPILGVPNPAFDMQAGAGVPFPNPEPHLNAHTYDSNPLRPAQYPCLHPRCSEYRTDERALDEHVKTHFAAPTVPNAGPAHAVGNGYTTEAVAFATPLVDNGYAHGGLMLPQTAYGYTTDAVAFTTPLVDNRYVHGGLMLPQTAYGYGASPGMTFQPDHIPQVYDTLTAAAHTSPGATFAAAATSTLRTTHSSIPSTPPTISPAAPPRHPCSYPGCTKTFTRPSDLARHAAKHNPLAKRYECEVVGCKYVGEKGFTRKDKLVDHQRSRH